jgi:hypothetical protein
MMSLLDWAVDSLGLAAHGLSLENLDDMMNDWPVSGYFGSPEENDVIDLLQIQVAWPQRVISGELIVHPDCRLKLTFLGFVMRAEILGAGAMVGIGATIAIPESTLGGNLHVFWFHLLPLFLVVELNLTVYYHGHVFRPVFDLYDFTSRLCQLSPSRAGVRVLLERQQVSSVGYEIDLS